MKENIDITKEGYSLEFLGKQYAKLIASMDTETILVPDEENNSKEEMIKRCRKWKPYSSYAARYLYRALDSGLTKTEFHLYK